MVSQKVLDTMKWWYETGRRDEQFFERLVTDGKITQGECDEILSIGT